jgi:hypothetical protein
MEPSNTYIVASILVACLIGAVVTAYVAIAELGNRKID